MLIAQTNTYRTGARKHTIDRPVRFGQVSVKFIMIGLLSALALLYLAQTTQGANRSYALRELEVEHKALLEERERLEVMSIRLRSLDTLQKEFPTTPDAEGKPAAWEPVNNVAYVDGARPVAGR